MSLRPSPQGSMAGTLPSATPIMLLYADAVRNRPENGHPVMRIYALAAGDVLVWAVFSVGATLVQRFFSALLMLTPMMEPATPPPSAVLLFVAGVYQLTPLKQVVPAVVSFTDQLPWLTLAQRSRRRIPDGH